jgi:hypothetical protein
VRRHYARLGLVLRRSDTELRLLFDCRPSLPELTRLQATDVRYLPGCDRLAGAATVQEALDLLCGSQGGKCTVVATPGVGWERVFTAIPNGADAEICFPVGAYPTPAAGVVVANKGQLTFSGSGPGTQIDNAEGECAIELRDCSSVTIRDLSIRSQRIGDANLRGALTCSNCREVTLDSVTLACGDNAQRNAACLTVRNQPVQDTTTATPSLRVRRCTILAGEQQHGILAINVVRAHIEDNTIVCPRPARVRSFRDLFRDRWVTGEAKRLVASKVRTLRAQEAAKQGEATVEYAGQRIAIYTPLLRPEAWRGYFAANPPPAGSAVTDAMRHVSVLAARLVTDENAWQEFRSVREILRLFERLPVSGFRGICLAGTQLQEARIINNTIKYFRHGIHIGLSHEERTPGVPDLANSVTIADNRIEARLMPGDEARDETPLVGARPRAPHAIFAGNVENLLIERNHAVVNEESGRRAQVGVVVHGQLGPRILIRENRIDGFRLAAQLVARPAPPASRLWLVEDNVCARCTAVASGALSPPISQVRNVFFA